MSLKLGLDVVFCGMAAGTRSAQRGAYYAGPGNRFWSVLHEVGLTSECLRADQYDRVVDYGIGLTDLVKRQFGSDAEVKAVEVDSAELAEKIKRFSPRYLAFNGKGAAKGFSKLKNVDYGLQAYRIGLTEVYVLPSTSRAANGFWSIEPWRELAAMVKSQR